MNVIQFLYLYSPNYIVVLIYMMQASEYHAGNYLKWYWRTNDFKSVMRRGSLDNTPKAMLLTLSAIILTSAQFILGAYLILEGLDDNTSLIPIGLGLIFLEPLITAHLLVVPLWLGTLLVQKPKTESTLSQARKTFADHPGVIIAVAGSYGKTTTKEILKTVLSAKLKVAATPANLNTPLALADFAETLEGDEDVVIVELGEFKPGDIREFAELVQPDSAVVTGLTEAHLDTLGSLETAAQNLLSLSEFVPSEALFVNEDSEKLKAHVGNLEYVGYSARGAMGWKITKAKTSLKGTTFTAKKSRTTISAKSELLGKHTVGVLGLSIALAKEFKLTKPQIEKGLAATKPFEHRLQLTRDDGVTIIDDTYNGNIDGVAAGVAFVKGLKAKRKVYVTPGLVEMGDKSDELNKELGTIVAPVFDAVALMKNAQTDAIVDGLHAAGFSGETTIVEDPLEFYQNLDSFTSEGDVVLMQNDLPDNYA